ncbi:hypothetical protein SUGI_0030050 [Cryptomeria japonica]|uniref:exocyst complex component EXO70A1 n=1 Tax=Cryptomeria japonica TaxID=3369 RepID=UPI002408CEDE|nr:exocyst complex component EXO70A1 [Cryptomeria japonica]GLJ05989.1 hypothetical protein SUGI_0030050 [Cryptomeria japonica]
MEIEEVADDRVAETAQQIVRSLGTSENETNDMLRILSNFDSRLSFMSPTAHGRKDLFSLSFSAAENLISKWDINSTNKILFQSGAEEVLVYMDIVENLQHLMQHLSAGGNASADLIRAQRLMKMAMARLEKEFHKILLSNSEAINPERWLSTCPSVHSSIEDSVSRSIRSSEDGSGQFTDNSSLIDRILEFDTVPLDAVADLRSIAEIMAKTGYGRECVRVFVLNRKSVVEESLYNLGVEKVKLSDVRKMKWELLDEKIKKWIYTAKISIRVVFCREKQLCDDVFEGMNKMRDACFAEIAKEATTRLLAFAEAVAATSRTPERIFRVLDLYETLTDLKPELEAIYCQDIFRSVHELAGGILFRLREAAKGMLAEFEKALEKDYSKTRIAGGTIHPLTRYTMNYLSFLSEYRETLINITADAPEKITKDLPEEFAIDDELLGPSAPLSIRLGWKIFLLFCKLDTRSDLYKDVALSYLFLMNNLHYIVQKVNDSELKYMLGKEWVRKQWNKVRHYAVNYERAVWGKVMSCLADQGSLANGGSVGGEDLKERLKDFNLAMEEVKKRHGGWVVPDVSLREKLVAAIMEQLIPDYASFLERYRTRFQSDLYVKYTAEELQDFVLDMFKGSPSARSM